jgi:hypothetical protein
VCKYEGWRSDHPINTTIVCQRYQRKRDSNMRPPILLLSVFLYKETGYTFSGKDPFILYIESNSHGYISFLTKCWSSFREYFCPPRLNVSWQQIWTRFCHCHNWQTHFELVKFGTYLIMEWQKLLWEQHTRKFKYTTQCWNGNIIRFESLKTNAVKSYTWYRSPDWKLIARITVQM